MGCLVCFLLVSGQIEVDRWSPCLQLGRRAVSGRTDTIVSQQLTHAEEPQLADHPHQESTVLSTTRVSLRENCTVP